MIQETIELPEGITAKQDDCFVQVSGKNGSVKKKFASPHVKMSVESGKVLIKSDKERKSDGATVHCWAAHVRNMIMGASKDFEYKLKVVYLHFPVGLSQSGSRVEMKNFLGGKGMRYAAIIGDTKVKIQKDEIIVSGPNIEHVGQTAANLERMCYKKDKDTRIFQDGIYITSKNEE